MKKKIDENEIYENYYEEIYEQVKNDPYAQSLGIQLLKFEVDLVESMLKYKTIW